MGSISNTTTRVLVASPSILIVNGLCELLRELAGVVVCASAMCAGGALEAARRQRPDVILVDREILAEMRPARGDVLPPARVVVVSARPHRGEERIAGIERACGMLHERLPPPELRELLAIGVRCRLRTSGADACDTCRLRETLCPPDLPLSPREYDVFVRIGRGMGTSGIATALGLSVKTVESHRESIKHKLGLATSSALAEAALLWRRGDSWHEPGKG
ncbi:MAG TPA: LuxR C-terminal-related transcriptional regulator [Xanthomonadales bacterium]|nr:LuxR C-terminal-related transcriptional regulator [Xanthomonadales bacterium]